MCGTQRVGDDSAVITQRPLDYVNLRATIDTKLKPHIIHLYRLKLLHPTRWPPSLTLAVARTLKIKDTHTASREFVVKTFFLFEKPCENTFNMRWRG